MNEPKVDNTTDEKRGLECRHCGCKHFRVVYTRPTWGGRTRCQMHTIIPESAGRCHQIRSARR